MKTVIILYNDGEYTTIKSKCALAIAYTHLQNFYDVEEFETIVTHDRNGRLYYLIVQAGVEVKWLIKPREN